MAESAVDTEQYVEVLTHILQCLGFVINFEKSVMTPNAGVRVPGDDGEYNYSVGQSANRQAQVRSCQNVQYELTVSSSPVTFFWQAQCSNPSHSSRSSVLPLPSKGFASNVNTQQSGLRDPSLSVNRGLGGADLVAGTAPHMERETAETETKPGDHHLRCLLVRMGSSVQRNMHGRCLVRGRAGYAHQLTGAPSSHSGGKDLLAGTSALLQLNNATAVAYTNNMGGTVSAQLTELAKELWMWCLDKDISLSAQHIPGSSNTIADVESRMLRDRSHWMLCPRIFLANDRAIGPLEVNLFASRLTYQMRCFFSWRLDPLAEVVDAFQPDWSPFRGFANPPWCLISRALRQACLQKAQLVLIAPV